MNPIGFFLSYARGYNKRMAIRLSTPYYLAGEQKQRFHSNQAEKGIATAAFTGAAAYGLTRPQFRDAAVSAVNMGASMKGIPVVMNHGHAKAGAQVLAFGAGAAASYGIYHGARAAKYKHDRGQKSQYYYRKQGGKRVRVAKGKRK